jgi:predicted nucleotidyltransferase
VVELSQALAALGLSLGELQRSSEQIVLFGSRAAGVAHEGSDWDLLVVGSGSSLHTQTLDLVRVTPHELASADWLASELACHVAVWGRWLHGAPDWVANISCGVSAAERKARRLASRLTALERAWGLLPPAYLCKHQLLVRRDLQRHAFLLRGEPVPPSPLLDEAWSACADPRAELVRLCQEARLCSGFLETLAVSAGA